MDKPFWGDSYPVKSCCENKEQKTVENVRTFRVTSSSNLLMTKSKATMEKELNNAGCGWKRSNKCI